MKYKTYHVISNKGFDVRLVKNELASIRGNTEIPSRQVEITDTCAQSKRCISCLLTDDEAVLLNNDPRIKCVEKDDPDIVVVKNATQYGDFRRSNNASRTNWGLLAHSHAQHVYTNSDTLKSGFTHRIDYSLAGEGVDIIIIDQDMIDHPDLQNEQGASRFIKHNWNDTWNQAYPDDIDNMEHYLRPSRYYKFTGGNHGTSCASMAAGKDYGFAKKSHIYFCKTEFGGTVPVISPQIWLALARVFHQNKKSNRPTIVSGSFGLEKQPLLFSNISGGGFRDSAEDDIETWNRGTKTADQIKEDYNLTWNDTGMPAQSIFMDTVLEETLDAGVHCFFSAGNRGVRSVKPDHPEYDNYVNTNVGQRFYNRPQSPYHPDSFNVGGLGLFSNINTDDKYQLASFSNRGSAVDVYVAGEFTRCASTDHADGSGIEDYPHDSNFKTQKFGGTSGACPLLAGIGALHLSSLPHLTPKQLKERIMNDTWAGIYVESGYLGSNPFTDSVNKVAYNRYNQAVSVSYNNAQQVQGNVAITKKPIFETQLHIQSSGFGENKHGIYRGQEVVQGYVIPYFANNDTSNIYPDSTITEFYSVEKSAGTMEYTLRFTGSEVYNGNWEKLHADVSGGREYQSVDLFRKDAIYNDASKTFVWTIESDVHIKTGNSAPQVNFGAHSPKRSTLYII